MACQRIFNGRLQEDSDYKHIVIDRYDHLVLLTTYHNSEYSKEFLEEFIHPTDEHIIWRERLKSETRWHYLKGEEVKSYNCTEDGLTYKLQLGSSQNVGLFLDMAHARKYVREHAQNKRILNLFSYTCSFSVAAIAGEASEVINVDMKSNFLNWGKENHKLSNQPLDKVKFLKHDILKSLNGYIKRGPFDLIILDPPTFQKGGFKLKQDYSKILKKLPQMLNERGIALICSNDPLQSDEEFLELVGSILPKENLSLHPLPFAQNFDGPKIIQYLRQ
jgi:23S rRNA (cytosine1962-C5)-methyltransferase